jgi:hypothetical protein
MLMNQITRNVDSAYDRNEFKTMFNSEIENQKH